MSPALPPRLAGPRGAPTDGWLGPHELPAYRAGSVVARLDDLPRVDPANLYFDLLLLDRAGRTRDFHCGPCPAVGRSRSLQERSRFVRVVAELVRHAPGHDGGLTPISPAIAYVRECGIATDRLVTAAQLVDNASGEAAVVSSLADMLELSLGLDEAVREMADVVVDLARSRGLAALDGVIDAPRPARDDAQACIGWINRGGLSRQLDFLVRTVGKSRARSHLRKITDFDMVPTPEMFGV